MRVFGSRSVRRSALWIAAAAIGVVWLGSYIQTRDFTSGALPGAPSATPATPAAVRPINPQLPSDDTALLAPLGRQPGDGDTRHAPAGADATQDGDVTASIVSGNAAGQAPAKQWVRVTGTVVNVRSEPSAEGERLTAYDRDTKLEYLDEKDGWIQVRDPDTDQRGWMFGRYLEQVPVRQARADSPAG